MALHLTVRWIVFALMVACSAPRGPQPPPPAVQELSRAIWTGDRATAMDLMDRGVDPEAFDANGKTALAWAVIARDESMLDVVLARVAHAKDTFMTRAMLRIAAGRNDVEMVEKLLAHGAAVDSAEDQRASALMVAAENGATSSVRRLLAAHADAKFTDPEGDTPLAAATRAGCLTCIDLIIAAGADVAHTDAVRWARVTNQPDIAAYLVKAGAPDQPAPPRPTTPTADEALARAVPLLQKVNAQWTADGECNACHHLPMAVRAMGVLQYAHVPVDDKLAQAAVDAIHADDHKLAQLVPAALAKPELLVDGQMFPAGDFAFGNAWFLAAELGGGLRGGEDQKLLATAEARIQQPDGHWRAGPFRGVIEWDDAQATSLAIEVIAGYGDHEAKRALAGARLWLEHAGRLDETVVDLVAHLRAAHALGLSSEAADTLRAIQHPDGSWGHTSLYGPGDAYSTGLAAVALIEAGGVDPHDPVIARAAAYLLSTQEPDGSWRVWSHAAPLLPYHDRGFPGGKLQFVSFAATAWAVQVLAYAR